MRQWTTSRALRPGTNKKEMESMKKSEFVKLLETVVRAAMGNIQSLKLVTLTNGEYVVATCTNGAKYQICVEADSLIATAYDVIGFLRFK